MPHKKTAQAWTAQERADMADAARLHASLNNTTPPNELLSLFGLRALIALNRHQWLLFAGGLVKGKMQQPQPRALLLHPVSKDFATEHEAHLHLLTQNKSIYDDPIEDVLDADPIIQHLQPLSQDRNDATIAQAGMNALRARRTVVAALGHAGLSATIPPDLHTPRLAAPGGSPDAQPSAV